MAFGEETGLTHTNVQYARTETDKIVDSKYIRRA